MPRTRTLDDGHTMSSLSLNSLRWTCAVLLLAPALEARTGVCAPITEERKASLCRYVQRKYRLADDVRPAIAEVSEMGGSCYRKLRFVASGKRNFDMSLFLSPDLRFLAPELNDTTIDPIAEEKRLQMQIRHNLEKDDGSPSLGSTNAPVAIVVFSDFQCPYCARLGETMKQISTQEKRVRFLFRNMPLNMHPWAKQAAETAACVQMQSPEAFWRVHDYLFEHQRELTPDNIGLKLKDFTTSLRSVRASQVGECLDMHLALPRIERDLSLASANKVSGTPTVFVNGQQAAGGAPTREYLLTLIRENMR